VKELNKLANELKKLWETMWPIILAVVLAFLVGALLLLMIGDNPLLAYKTMFNGAFGSSNRIAETVVKATALMIMALGTSIAFRCQIWNIGGEGQFVIGVILALAIGLNVNLPPALLFPLTFIAAFIGGGLWGSIASYLKVKFNASEVITTIMLNYVANYFLAWLIRGPMMDPAGHNFPQTPLLADSLHLPILLKGTRLNFGLVIGLLLALIVYYLWKTPFGFSVLLTGESQEVARYSGLDVSKTVLLTMFISAGFAGLCGWVEVFGIHYRLLDDISVGYGNLAVVIALLGNLNPIGILFASFFFSALIVGGNTMQRMQGIPFSIVDVIQGLVIIFVISRFVFQKWGDKLASRNI